MSSPSSSTPSSPRYRLKRSISVANSSDTDITPPRKRSRRERVALAQTPDCDLDDLLRRRIHDPKDRTALDDFKCMKRLRRDEDVAYVARDVMDKVKATVKRDIHAKDRKILEVELYMKWLDGLEYVPKAVEAALNAKVPGTRRRVPGLGRLSFSLLYHLIEGFIDEVNAHQDGWSFRYPVGPIEPDPLIMTLAEEANEPHTDGRSEDAVRTAEQFFARYDRVMMAAVRRYKAESNKKLMAAAMERKEESLARGCCLLSEQTGYGGTDDMGFKLLEETRGAMMEWKREADSSAEP
ncbi:hypothetical protein LshimejAT787_2300220 [Lyophyllum shimeji]|uniref:Uncharacterized protein n=1 Tax=Lyophyllum shimeji TaxID=47721 RepID=A0A9P3UUT1_LYOSH|nr:hypothetical protein LshimejAT787_2300220 [Lyophyllum shimeji]